MKKSRFTEEQIAYALRLAESGTPVADVCRQIGISDATFYTWKKKYAEMGVSELRKLKQLEHGHDLLDRKTTASHDTSSSHHHRLSVPKN